MSNELLRKIKEFELSGIIGQLELMEANSRFAWIEESETDHEPRSK